MSKGLVILEETLSKLLYAVAAGQPHRVKEVILATDELGEKQREKLLRIAEEESLTPGQHAQRFGDAFREIGDNRDIVNEFYRLAFYLSEAPADLSTNPLFSFFLSNRSGPLLDKWVHYFPIYHRHLAGYRGRAPRLLEIGVGYGGSLEMWERYFGPSAKLIGLDIEERAAGLAGPNRTVVIGDQADRSFLTTVAEEHGPFDVVIDDGGHTMSQQITSVETLFPYLNDGGVYLVEDCHTSYWDEYDGGAGRAGTFIEWVKQRVDDLNGYHYADLVDPVWTDQVDGVHCYDSVVILDKKRRFRPFSEQVGASEFVYFSRLSISMVSEMADSATKQTAAARAEVKELKAHLIEAEAELSSTRTKLTYSRRQLRAMRGTLSWRVTAPLRAIRRRVRRG